MSDWWMTDEGIAEWNRQQDARQAELKVVLDHAEKHQREMKHQEDVAYIRRVANQQRVEAGRWLRQNVNEHRKALGLPSLIAESIAEFKREMARMSEAARESADSWRKMMAQVERDLS